MEINDIIRLHREGRTVREIKKIVNRKDVLVKDLIEFIKKYEGRLKEHDENIRDSFKHIEDVRKDRERVVSILNNFTGHLKNDFRNVMMN